METEFVRSCASLCSTADEESGYAIRLGEGQDNDFHANQLRMRPVQLAMVEDLDTIWETQGLN